MGCLHKLFVVLHGRFAYFPHLYVYFIMYLYHIYTLGYNLIRLNSVIQVFQVFFFFFSTFKFSGTIGCSGLILYIFFIFFFKSFYLWMPWVFAVGLGLSLVARGGAPLVVGSGFPLRRLLLQRWVPDSPASVAVAPRLYRAGSGAPWHVGSSPTGAQTHVPSSGRQS